MSTFEACARAAFEACGHAFDDVLIDKDEETGFEIAIVECVRCGGDITYDNDTQTVIGDTRDAESGNYTKRCRGAKAKA